MARVVRRRPQARIDLAEYAIFIARENPDAAEKFLNAAQATFQTLLAMPGMGSLCHFSNPELQGIRRWAIKGFDKYLIFYQPIDDGIEVVRIIHASRDIEKIFEAQE
ncbi:MAG: type II toxin-antitoxin system RelE/ParE family toxin [Symploca sp. SIO1B1]|nr:type II toxin-antitoxin system RelE/ParE family toxin [Symploca sp. SIO1B1]